MDDTPSTSPKDARDALADMYRRALKPISPAQLEAAIAKALGEITGDRYEVVLQRIEFEPKGRNAFDDTVDLAVRVTRRDS